LLAPAFLLYLQHVCRSELRRRKRQRVTLNGPAGMIAPEARGEAFVAVAVLLTLFDDNPAVRALLEAIGDALDAGTAH
jgi:hypothetical protein